MLQNLNILGINNFMGILKKYWVILAGVIILIGLGAAAYFFILNPGDNQEVAKKVAVSNENIKQLKPEDIGVTFDVGSDKKSITMNIAKVSGVSSFDYEVNYNAKGNIPRGVIGSIQVTSGSSISRDILLGTCSKNVCKYDEGVTEVNFVIKVNYSNGEVGSVTQNVKL